MTCIRVEVAPKAGPEFPSFPYIAGRHLKEAGLKGRPLQLSFPDSLSGSTVTRDDASTDETILPREMVEMEAQFDSNRAVKYVYNSRVSMNFPLRSRRTKYHPSIDVSFDSSKRASSHLIRKRSVEV